VTAAAACVLSAHVRKQRCGACVRRQLPAAARACDAYCVVEALLKAHAAVDQPAGAHNTRALSAVQAGGKKAAAARRLQPRARSRRRAHAPLQRGCIAAHNPAAAAARHAAAPRRASAAERAALRAPALSAPGAEKLRRLTRKLSCWTSAAARAHRVAEGGLRFWQQPSAARQRACAFLMGTHVLGRRARIGDSSNAPPTSSPSS
jgi:hypothetical protein